MNSKNRGITLIALIITIILLLILAGIAISSLTESGLFQKATLSKEKSKIAELTEKLEMEEMLAKISENPGTNLNDYLEVLKTNQVIGENDIEIIEEDKSANITVEDEYIFLVEDLENGDLKIEYQGKAGKLLPRIQNITTIVGETGLTVKITSKRAEQYEIYIKTSEEENYNKNNMYSVTSTSEEIEYTFSNVEFGKDYEIKVIVKNANGEVNQEKTGLQMTDVTEPIIGLTASTDGWTNKPVTLTGKSQDIESGIVAYGWTETANEPVGTTTTGELGKWTEISKTTEEITQTIDLEANGTRYFWTRDSVGNINNASTTISKIEKILPEMVSLTKGSIDYSGTNPAVTLTGKAKDITSGIQYFQFSMDENLTADSTGWSSISATTSQISKTKSVSTDGIWYFYVKDQAGNVNKNSVIVEILDTVQEAITSNKVLSTTANVTLKDANGNKIVVPAGFKIVSGTTTVDKGIVIEDVTNTATLGSQFVWIPVPNNGFIKGKNGSNVNDVAIKLDRYTFDTNGVATAQENNVIDTYYQELATSTKGNITAKSISDFKISVEENEGYYIGRYEARKGTSGLTLKATDTVYNNIQQPNAATLSRNMYTNKVFESDLMNSYAWDTAVLFLQECGTNPTYSRKTRVSSSFSTTGTTTDVECNVYDMASNCREWTTETSSASSNPCVLRGGFYNGSTNCTIYRSHSTTSNSIASFGCRPLLYL